MTLGDLRERCKATYAIAAKVPNGLNSKPRFRRGMNMREAWVQICKTVEWHNEGIVTGAALKPIQQELLDFYHAGQIYYYAKKHGVDAAMLYRLAQVR